MRTNTYHLCGTYALKGGGWYNISKSWPKWIKWFNDLENMGVIDLSSELHTRFLWVSFAHVIQTELDATKEKWNCHYLVKSQNLIGRGFPNVLYQCERSRNCAVKIDDGKIQDIKLDADLVQDSYLDGSMWEDYCDQELLNINVKAPTNYKEGIAILKSLCERPVDSK